MAYWHNNYTVLETMEFLNENLTLPGNLTDIEFNKAKITPKTIIV
jgi:hypothetical protein